MDQDAVSDFERDRDEEGVVRTEDADIVWREQFHKQADRTGRWKQARKTSFDIKIDGNRAGDVCEVSFRWPLMLFRAEKLVVVETVDSRETANASKLSNWKIDGVPAMPAEGKILCSQAFGLFNLGAGIEFPVVHPGGLVTWTLSFEKDCNWFAVFCGKAVPGDAW